MPLVVCSRLGLEHSAIIDIQSESGKLSSIMTLFKTVSLLFLEFFLVEHVSSSNAVSRSFKKQNMNVFARLSAQTDSGESANDIKECAHICTLHHETCNIFLFIKPLGICRYGNAIICNFDKEIIGKTMEATYWIRSKPFPQLQGVDFCTFTIKFQEF